MAMKIKVALNSSRTSPNVIHGGKKMKKDEIHLTLIRQNKAESGLGRAVCHFFALAKFVTP